MRLFKDEKDYIREQVESSIRDPLEQEEKNFKDEMKNIIMSSPSVQPFIQVLKSSNPKIKDEDLKVYLGYGGVDISVDSDKFDTCCSEIRYTSKKIENFYQGNSSCSDWKYLSDSEILELTLPIKTPTDDERYGIIEKIIKSLTQGSLMSYKDFTTKRLTELRKILG